MVYIRCKSHFSCQQSQKNQQPLFLWLFLGIPFSVVLLKKIFLDKDIHIVYFKSKRIYGCYEWLQPSLPFGDNKDTTELTVGEGRETRRCSQAGRIVLYPQGAR